MENAASVKSATRVLDLLELLESLRAPIGVSEVARRLQIPKSSASMLLSTLERRNYAVCDAERRYALHPMFRGKSRSWVGGFRALLLQAARAAMERLAQSTGETLFLAVPRGDHELEFVAKVVSPQEVRVDVELYTPRPLHAISLGLVILAFQSEERIEAFLKSGRLQRFTPKTICDPDELRRELMAIRRRGYAINRDSHVNGLSGIAAPVFNAAGDVVAALGVSAPSLRFRKILGVATAELVGAAEALSQDLSIAARRQLGEDANLGDSTAIGATRRRNERNVAELRPRRFAR